MHPQALENNGLTDTNVLPVALHQVRSVVHHNGEKNYHGGKESQLNFYENMKTFLYVRNSLVGDVKLKNIKSTHAK